MNRRSFLTLEGVAGMASVGLPPTSTGGSSRPGPEPKKTSVILLWLDGGPSHMDLYDMKPEAPEECRGIWRPMRTRVPGFEISELFPKQAGGTDKFSLVRSLHHDNGDHFTAGHFMLTSKDMGVSGANQTQRFPGIGAHLFRGDCWARVGA